LAADVAETARCAVEVPETVSAATSITASNLTVDMCGLLVARNRS